jgi:cytidine deaminase
LFPKQTEVIMANTKGDIEVIPIHELLPAPFDRSFL